MVMHLNLIVRLRVPVLEVVLFVCAAVIGIFTWKNFKRPLRNLHNLFHAFKLLLQEFRRLCSRLIKDTINELKLHFVVLLEGRVDGHLDDLINHHSV